MSSKWLIPLTRTHAATTVVQGLKWSTTRRAVGPSGHPNHNRKSDMTVTSWPQKPKRESFSVITLTLPYADTTKSHAGVTIVTMLLIPAISKTLSFPICFHYNEIIITFCAHICYLTNGRLHLCITVHCKPGFWVQMTTRWVKQTAKTSLFFCCRDDVSLVDGSYEDSETDRTLLHSPLTQCYLN